jgi:undecaprenyl-diphosphatase
MNLLQAIVLGLVQGATEFIPISSSGHLVLVPWWFSWPSPGLAFDTVLHLGTLLAVLAVLWPDLVMIALDWWHCVTERRLNASGARPAWWILLGTIPAALMGVLWEEQFEALFGSPLHVAILLLVTGLWLAVAEGLGRKEQQADEMAWWQPLLIGVAQGLAIAPGISRSGATIGAGLILGLERESATRFSFLLSTPIILGAGVLQVVKLLRLPNLEAQLLPLALGFVAAFLSGYACIRFLLDYVKRRSLIAFSAYCGLVGLGSIVLWFLR